MKTMFHDLFGLKSAILSFFALLFSQLRPEASEEVTSERGDERKYREEEMEKQATAQLVRDTQNGELLSEVENLLEAVKEGRLEARVAAKRYQQVQGLVVV